MALRGSYRHLSNIVVGDNVSPASRPWFRELELNLGCLPPRHVRCASAARRLTGCVQSSTRSRPGILPDPQIKKQ